MPLAQLQADEIRVVFPNQPARKEYLQTFYLGNIEYLNTQELADIFSADTYENESVGKQVINFRDSEIKITAFSSFVVINDKSYQMPAPSYFDGKEYYLPARSFFTILSSTVLPGAIFDESRRSFVGPRSMLGYNIHSAVVESKRNGTLIRIRTSAQFDMRNVVRYITDNGWLVVQVPDALVDTLELGHSSLGGLIRSARGRQLDNSAELRFKLTEQVPLPEVYQVQEGRELHIALRNPDRRKNNRPEEMRKQWYLDTIVIDPGHGGKDAGTIGHGGLMEKTVVLDVSLRLGKLIRRRTNMKVVYTRDEDVFVPLFQRTRMANEAGGKVFISVHVNSVKNNRTARGIETWLLAPSRTEEAIAMAQQENSVIALEESNHKYKEFSDETLILSTMAQSAWLKESETLAGIIQSELVKKVDSPDRGVKQGEFYVLVGASMPNVLVELCFISNRYEEKKLGQSQYRQLLAEGILNAILKFKKQQESAMLAGQ
ncbi:MAG: N-acetylmuramoyl-L-alanine amidase [Candidatus Marinimicrobia bacterium]|nr:N-acetylmuramoyl-L-alanine amidase [Candidatus Neomarinimicrobiota bacterium]